MQILQIRNSGNMGIMNCLDQGGLCSLSALLTIYKSQDDIKGAIWVSINM